MISVGIDSGRELGYTEDMSNTVQIDSWMTQSEAALKFGQGWTWEPSPGRCVHIGAGLWATMCRECDHTVTHWGPMPAYASIGQHERTHGLDVAGINVGMLP